MKLFWKGITLIGAGLLGSTVACGDKYGSDDTGDDSMSGDAAAQADVQSAPSVARTDKKLRPKR